MRLFELILIGLLFCQIVGHLSVRYRQWRGKYVGVLLTAIVLIAHLAIEGYRWQMVPAYGLAMILFLTTAVSALPRKSKDKINTGNYLLTASHWLMALVACLLLSASYLAGSAFPVVTLPEPDGPYAVGHTSYAWTDNSRPEVYSPAPDDFRRLAVQVWYPADEDSVRGKDTLPYWTRAHLRSKEMTYLFGQLSDMQLPGLLFNHFRLINTHAYAEAELATSEEKFPVVVFSHGLFGGYAGQNTVLMETLASHGYVVFAIEHTYWGLLAEFSDGPVGLSRTLLSEYAALGPETTNPKIEALDQAISQSELGNQTVAKMREYLRLVPQHAEFYRNGHKSWSADQRFVLDKIAALTNSDSRFSDKLDLNRIGLLGMSFGSPSSFLTCSVDQRCRAAVDLDGINRFSSTVNPLDVPYLYIRSRETRMSFANHQSFAKAKNRASAYILDINNAEHFDFSDFPLVIPVFKYADQLGSIPSQRIVALTNDYVLAFFDQHLKQTSAHGMPAIDKYSSEVRFYSQ